MSARKRSASALVTTRWTSTTVFLVCMVVLGITPVGTGTALVAAIAAVFLIVMCASFYSASGPPRAPRG